MSEGNGRDTDKSELGPEDDRERDTLPPPSLEAQLAHVEGLLGDLMLAMPQLQRTLAQHALAITTVEHKANELLGIPARVAELERLVGLADGAT